MSKRAVEGCYARLIGIKESIPSGHIYIARIFSQDYGEILNILRKYIDDRFEGFDTNTHDFFAISKDRVDNVISTNFLLKLNQLIRYLEMVYQATQRIVQVGSIYNSIQDTELKSRCGDLLSATDHFDRVINQATQV